MYLLNNNNKKKVKLFTALRCSLPVHIFILVNLMKNCNKKIYIYFNLYLYFIFEYSNRY